MATQARAHDDTQTHARLSVGSLLFLDQGYPEDGALFPIQDRDRIRWGSVNEDGTNFTDLIFRHHFFNPKTGEAFSGSALTAPRRAADFWPLAIQHYRAGQRSIAFEHLGHVLHLLQDMTSPAHVHIDNHGQVLLGHCEGDGDDFEVWGYCDDLGINGILQYISTTNIHNSAIRARLAAGLQSIFGNQPQRVAAVGADLNTAYSFVRGVANQVYDFTTFQVTLTDTFNGNDLGGGELKRMFSTLEETTVPAAWWIENIGYSQGQCNDAATPFNQSWWMMSCRQEGYCGPWYAPTAVYCVEGMAYLENVGGGTGATFEVPDNLYPAVYERDWFRKRYGSFSNTGPNRNSMLRIYGDVLYSAAVAYGAGLLQAFLDEAVMPKPITTPATQLTGVSAQLNGQARPAGEAASAWFEWGTSTSYGNATSGQDAGTGQSFTNVSARIEGLTADTLYYCRIVSSNRFGLRHGTNQTFRTPAVLVGSDVPNAWQITDHSTTATLGYTTNLSAEHQQAASSSGWRYAINSRMVDDFGGSKTMTFFYQAAVNRRFLIWWDLDSNGNLTAEMEGQPALIVATNGLGSTRYHTHEIQCTNGIATYLFDGTALGTWTGVALSTQPAGHVQWGGGSSVGMAQMNFRDVGFAITGVGTVASYHAGAAPALAPNPVTQGWTANPALPVPPVAVAAISPDFEGYLPDVTTMPATEVRPTSARLNGRLNPLGQSSVSWFEWGTSTGYGNRTAARALGNGFAFLEVGEDLSSLIEDETYHFRFVASNSFTLVFGQDQLFRTGGFIGTNAALAAVDIGSVAWGDHDGDGDLDVLVTGQTGAAPVSRIYRNNGNGSFTELNRGLAGVAWGAAVWGDYNNDGELDILLSGAGQAGPISRIYRSTDGGFFNPISASLPDLSFSAVAWFDCDNDGDQDILISGQDAANNRLARVYRNDGATNFVDIQAGLAGASQGAVATGDFDGDGDQDIVLTGRDAAGNPGTEYYRNDGNGAFIPLALNLPGAYDSSLAAGDYDNDGDLDLLLSGWTATGPLTRLFRNVRSGNQLQFEAAGAALMNVSSGAVAWGDYDNDGDLDVVVAGWRGAPFGDVYRNDGNDVFTPLNAGLTGVFWSSAAWGDSDNDGDLDLLLTGRDDQGGQETRAIRLYRNESPVGNAAPASPASLAGAGVGDSATVTWAPATDAETPSAALTYNLVLSATPEGALLASPMANLANGFRRVAQSGNAGLNLSAAFTGLTPGTYYFSVQAIDSAFAGGPFAPWHAVEVTPFPVVIIASEVPQPGEFRLRFAGPGGDYEVQRSVDLSNWTPRGPGVAVSPGSFEFTDTGVPAAGAFYRVRSPMP